MNNVEYYLADAIDIIEEVLRDGGEFRLAPKGTSMLPLIVQGEDSVILSRRNEGQPVYRREIAFYRRSDGAFVLHRVMRCEKDETYTMCGDNQLVMEQGIRSEQIIGYVTKIVKNEKERSTKSLSYRIYVFFWCFMPYRRGVMFWKRGIRFLKRRLFSKGKD